MRKPLKKSPRSFGERMAMIRKAYGDAQDDVASFLQVSRAAVSQWEKDQTTPRVDHSKAFADHYGISMEWLLFDKGEPPVLPTSGERRARPQELRFFISHRRNGPIDALIIHELDDALKKGQWSLPAHLFGPQARHSMVVLQTNIDAPPFFTAGDYVFVDQSKTQIDGQGYWVIETKNIGRLIVRSELKIENDKIELSAGTVPIDTKVIKTIIGRVAGKFCLV